MQKDKQIYKEIVIIGLNKNGMLINQILILATGIRVHNNLQGQIPSIE